MNKQNKHLQTQYETNFGSLKDKSQPSAFSRFFALCLLLWLLPLSVFAAPILELDTSNPPSNPVGTFTWNTVGLDSNNVTVGPNLFPVGVQVCDTADLEDAENVTAVFVWDETPSPNYLNLQSGSPSSITIESIADGDCADFYFNIEVTRDSNAYDFTRDFHIDITADNAGSIATTAGYEIYVEKLISQNRNDHTSVNSPGILYVGEEYTISMTSETATQGYEQIESYLTFNGGIFQVLSATATYTKNGAPVNTDTVYGDACQWENDPASTDYMNNGSCTTNDKAGGDTEIIYQVKIISAGSDALGGVTYDFSGSSFHYNSDFGDLVAAVEAVLPSTLTGTVWLDQDGDGFNDIGEPGIPNVTLALVAETDMTYKGVDYLAGQTVATVTADANGEYTFDGLQAGSYHVDVTDANGELTGLGIAPGSTDPSGTITVLYAETVEQDFGYIPATGTAAIGGTLWSDADGDGVKDTDELIGIAGITVNLLDSTGTIVATAITGADGSYLFTGVTPGDYQTAVDLTDTDLLNFCTPTAISACTTTATTSNPITVTADDVVSGVDFGFDSGSDYTLSDKIWNDADGDGVLDAGETGIAGVTVDLIDCGADGICGTGDDLLIASTITDADGNIVFAGVPDGIYQMVISDNTGELVDYQETTALFGSKEITISGADLDSSLSPSFGYNQPGSISGTVWSDSSNDGTMDAGEAGIAGVTVELLDSNGIVVATTITATDGSYSFSELAAGGALPAGDYTIAVPTAPGGTLTASPGTITLVTGESLTNNDFGYFDASLTDISGTVFDDYNLDGSLQTGTEPGIAGVTVALSPVYDIIDGGLDVNGDGVVNANDDGFVNGTIDGVEVINGALDINGDGIIDATDDGSFNGIAVIDGQLDVDGSGTVDASDDGALVGNPIAVVTSDANGDYSFADVPDGNYLVAVTDADKVLESSTLTSGLDTRSVSANGTDVTGLDFGYATEEQTAIISSSVWLDSDGDGIQDPSESGLSGVTVELWEDTDGDGVGDVLIASAVTDADGNYSFANLPAGEYQINVSVTTLPADLTATTFIATPGISGIISLSEGETSNDAAFGYEPDAGTAVLGGTVWADVDADGLADAGEVGIGGVTITVYESDGTTIATTTGGALATAISAPDGSWLVTDLPAGTYVVKYDDTAASLTNFVNDQPTNMIIGDIYYDAVAVAAGDVVNNLDFGFDDSTTGSISGTIYQDADGSGSQDAGEVGLANVTLNLLDSSDNIVATVTTDADGNYNFDGIIPGDYTLQISDTNNVLDGLNTTEILPGTITVTAGSSTDADAGYAPETATGSIGSLVWNDLDNDGIVDLGEPGLAGVTLEVWVDVDGNGIIEPGVDNLVRTTTTDANGEYFFASLPAGEDYIVTVTDDNGITSGFAATVGPVPGDDNNSQSDPYLVSDPASYHTADFGYFIVGTRTISGTVFDDADNSGDDNGGTEAGVEGVTVNLYRIVNGIRTLFATTTTDADGNYSFGNLPDGNYELEVDTSGSTIDGYTQTTPSGALPVTLNGADFTDGDFGFYQGAFVTNPVTLRSFSTTAGAQAGEVLFEWSTATETGNIGFNLYAQNKGKWSLVNDAPVLSEAGDSVTMTKYSYQAIGVEGSKFLIVDIDTQGKQTDHGPFMLNQSYGQQSTPEAVDWVAIGKEHKLKKDKRDKAKRSKVTLAAISNGTATVNLEVTTTGLQRVTHEQLLAMGVDLKDASLSAISLTNKGQPVALRIVNGNGNGTKGRKQFGSGYYIEFLGEALDTLYSKTNVYSLVVDSTQRSDIATTSGTAGQNDTAASFYMETVTVEPENSYSVSSPTNDPWYAARMLAYGGAYSGNFAIEVDHYVNGAATVTASLSSWGATSFPADNDHHMIISFNDQQLADAQFDGLTPYVINQHLPDSALQNGVNQFNVALPLDTGNAFDLVNLDYWQLNYPRQFVAVGDQLSFTAQANAFEVSNFTSADIIVYRDLDGVVEYLDQVDINEADGFYKVRFAGAAANASYYVSAVSALSAPAISGISMPADINTGAADYLIIAHPDFIGAELDQLVQLRQADYSIKVVSVDDIYAQYSHSMVDADAIRDYVRHAYNTLGVRTVLLVGGDSYDYHNYLGLSAISFIPSLYARTDAFVGHAPVDALYADVDADELPDLAIGRLPVRTSAELGVVANKIIAYEQRSYTGTALFVSDQFDTYQNYSFANDSDRMADALPASWQIGRVYLDDMPLADAQTALSNAIETGLPLNGDHSDVSPSNRTGGVSLVSFAGHSGPVDWTFAGLLNSTQTAELNNADNPTVVTQWGCWNTYFVSPYENTMGHSFMLNQTGGAAAVLGASTLTEASAERDLALQVYNRLFNSGMPVGQAVLEAKRAFAASHLAQRDVILGWTLLGDPAMIIQQ